MKQPTDPELAQNAIIGDIAYRLENSTQEDKEMLLRLMVYCGKSRQEVEEIRDSYGIYYRLPDEIEVHE